MKHDHKSYAAGHPGWKGDAETSREAAEAIAPDCGRLQRLALDAIRRAGEDGMTAEEVAEALEVARVSAQPRISELRRKGLVEKSNRRRRNPSSGKSAVAWIAVTNGEADRGPQQAQG